ncbi:MAG: acyltransferase family protein [Acidimicrobiia bacterium]
MQTDALIEGPPVPAKSEAAPVTVGAGPRDPGLGSSGIAYQPGLDGLRGLALAAILVFHAGFAWAPGAFLSVSTFFTLSGFLITTLLLGEHRRRGHIDLRAFWSRRFRRLLPASLLAIAGIVLASSILATANQLERLRGDVVAALAYVANWHFIASGDAYGALFATRSPMQHFWSLAIEEQFYFVYPLLMAVLFAVSRGSRRMIGLGLAGLIACSLGASLVLQATGASVDRLYFGTDVRAAELLLGGLVAVVWARHGERLAARGRWVTAASGAVALALMLVLWRFAHRTDIGWFRGGLLAYACVTSAVILAALQPAGPVRRVLSWRPLVAVGLVSYGAYLIHWPVFVWLDESTGLPPWPLFGLRLAVTFALAVPSYLFVEQPIRHGRLHWKWGLTLAPISVAAILAGTQVVPAGAVSQATQIANSRSAFVRLAREEQAGRAKRIAAGVPTMAPFGDSTAAVDGFALARWTDAHKQALVPVEGWPHLGCGVLEYDRLYRGGPAPYDPQCRGWIGNWRRAVAASRPDLAVVMLGPWEVTDIRLPGDARFRAIGDPAVDAALVAKLGEAVDTLLANGARRVVLVTSPPIESGRVDGQSPPSPFPESDPARMARWNAIQREVAASRRHVGVVDLAAYLGGRTDDHRLRPDGVHFTNDTALEITGWLGPRIARSARTL